MKTAARRAAKRVLVLTVLAALVYGGWAMGVNLRHGLAIGLRAGAVQGGSSATTTLVMSAAVERLYAMKVGWLVAWLVPASLGACLHLTVHLLAGTPEILVTIFPSVTLGVVFAGTYVLGLRRAQKTTEGGATTILNPAEPATPTRD